LDANVLMAGMGGLMIVNTALGFYIIKLRHKIVFLEEQLTDKESK
jgi:hypothetical protein